MLTAEIRVNGTLVKTVYAHNEAAEGMGFWRYEWIVVDTLPYEGKPPKVHSGEIRHERQNGIGQLVRDILDMASDDD